MSTLDRAEFCKVYIPMAREGKTAHEIALALGLEGDKKTISQKVSQKTTMLRKTLQKEAEIAAKTQGLDAEATAELVRTTVAKIPKLRRRSTSPAESLSNFLDELLAEADADVESPETPE